jgi:cobalamin biosynthesis Mg chelatase CobN
MTTTLSWSTSNVATDGCAIMPSPLQAAKANGTWTSPAITASTTYTLTCVNSANKTVSQNLTVSLLQSAIDANPITPIATPTTDSTNDALKITASNGQQISNGATTTKVDGLTTLDPTNITDATKEQSITKVEYYKDIQLIQTDYQAPFALDTTKLNNGQYNITERTYFNDGSHSQTTKLITVANASATQTTTKSTSSKAGVIIVLIILLLLVAGTVVYFLFMRRPPDSTEPYGGEEFFNEFTPPNPPGPTQ